MTVDKEKLKALAEAANAVTTDVNITMAVGADPEEVKAVQEYLQVAMPKTILALLAEIERLGLKADSLEFAKWSCQVNQEAIRSAGHETIDDLAAERDQLKAENESLRSLVLSALEEGKGRPGTGGNAPGHCHGVPGVWDRGNGDRSGTACGWCKIWNAAQAMAKEASHG